MSLIVAARFETFDEAKEAAAGLMSLGVVSEDMHTFFVNPAGAHGRFPVGGDRVADPQAKGAPWGAWGGAAGLAVVGAIIGSLIGFSLGNSLLPIAGGAGVGAYIGSLIGGVSRMGKSGQEGDRVSGLREAGRTSGVLLAVRVDPGNQQQIAKTLQEHGGIEIERAQGRWEDGQWKDFDPLVMGEPQAAGTVGRPTSPP